MNLCRNHDNDEAYLLLTIEVFEHRLTGRLYTTHEIKKDVCRNEEYEKIHLNDIFWKGFFECKQGLFLVNLAVGFNFPDHYVVIDSDRKLLIDPSYEQPISFQVLYTNGQPDKTKWVNLFKKLGYRYFFTMHQLYSKNSRFCVQPAIVAVGPADIVGLASANANGVKPKKSRRGRKKKTTTQQTNAVALTPALNVVALTPDIVAMIIGVSLIK